MWGPTKTYARRTVHLPRFLCDQLAAHLAERPLGPDDHVFTAPQGGPLREQKFVAGIFKPAAARAGLPHRLRFHDLRHTCASLLIAQGANDPRVNQAESEQIVEALQKHGVPHEYLLYEDEGHGFARPENRLHFYAAAERFLAEHLPVEVSSS